MIPHLGSLAPTRGGHARFYVDGHTGTMGGGTFRKQISIWEWDGRIATPQFIRSYFISFDTGRNEFADGMLRIPIKGDYKSFFSCGGCPEPEIVWTLQVTPDGVRDLGKKHVVPELQQADELFDRLLHGRSTRDLASPRVAAKLRKLVDYGPDPGLHQLGMLMEWHVTADGLELLVDDVDCGPLRFRIEKRARGLYFSDVQLADRCH